MTAVEDLGTIASVWAHPDDETYLAGGVMAVAADNGQRVVCVSATAGEHGTDDADTWPPHRLGALRRQEAAAAMAILGVTDHRWLDYEDGTLDTLVPDGPVGRLVDLFEEVRPDTILSFGLDGVTFHPDHQAVGRWILEAWERTGRNSDLFQAATTADHKAAFEDFFDAAGVYMTDERPVGREIADLALHAVLDDARLDRKVAALAAMSSQTAPLSDALGPDTYRTFVAVEAFVDVPRP